MPFYGRPSQNCQSCRERRIKCDRLDPVCSQCKRAGKPCGGYRDLPSLLFRDENDKTARRSAAAKAKYEARCKQSNGSDRSDDNYVRSVTRFDSSLSNHAGPKARARTAVIPLPVTVSTSLEEQGLVFFFSRFVSGTLGLAGDYVQGLEKLPFLRAIITESPMRDATISVGLAAKSNLSQDRVLALAAREKYVAAIHVVRKAVQNPERADANRTLQLIVMLTLYEMVCCTSNAINSWTVHLDGVAALVKHTSFGNALKTANQRPRLQYCFISAMRYFLDQGAMSSELLDGPFERMPCAQPDHVPAIQLLEILIRFMRLHSTTRQNPGVDPRVVIKSFMLCDAEFETWENGLPEKWRFNLKASDDARRAFNGKYMVYNDVWASRDLNHYFWARLMLNERILHHLSMIEALNLDDMQQQRKVLSTTSRMATCICAGAASQMDAPSGRFPSAESTQLPLLNGVFMLLFPLSVAGSAAGVSEEVHQWVIQLLQKIGQTLGIRRALELIPSLKQARERSMRQSELMK